MSASNNFNNDPRARWLKKLASKLGIDMSRVDYNLSQVAAANNMEYTPSAPSDPTQDEASCAARQRVLATQYPSNFPGPFPPAFTIFGAGKNSKFYRLVGAFGTERLAVRGHTGLLSPADVEVLASSDSGVKTVALINSSKDYVSVRRPRPESKGIPDRKRDTKFRDEGHTLFPPAWRFHVEVALPGGTRRQERFIWKGTNGPEIQVLGGFLRGEKLVRSSANEETVALCVKEDPEDPFNNMHFRFIGSAADGTLGEDFAFVAVTTAIGHWWAGARR